MPDPAIGDVRIAFEGNTALPIAVAVGSASAAAGISTTQAVELVPDQHLHDVPERPVPLFEALPIALAAGAVLAWHMWRYRRRC